MQISPIPASGGSVDQAGQLGQNVRVLKMRTNVTPGREEPPPAVQELTIPDATKEPVQAGTEDTQPLNPQMASLAKERRALQVKERELADREKALASKAVTPEDSVPIAKLKSNAMRTLMELGIPYEQLTQEILADQSGMNPEILALKAELKSLKEGVDKTLTDRDARAEQDALAEMRKEAIQLSAQGEDFEMVRETNQVPTVMKLIERTYRESGEVLDVKEAMQLVEAELVSNGLKLARLKKVQGQLAPAQPVPQPPQQQRQMRTLTNRDTASVPMSPKARALAAFNGTLKK